MGVEPLQVVDALSLMGDAVDNIKGVPGIGEKGARELIRSFGSLDRLLERAIEVTQKRYRAALLAHADAALQSRELLAINTDAPVPFEPDALHYSGPDRDRCFALFSRLGFRTLVAEFAPTASTVTRDYAIVRTLSELRSVIDAIQSKRRCGMHVLSDSSDTGRLALVGVALSTEPRRAHYIPLGHRALDNDGDIDATEALALLRPMISDAHIRKVGHDVKADMLVLADQDIAFDGIDADTMLVSYLLDATRPAHRFEDLVLEHVGYRAISTEGVLGKGAKALAFADLPAAGLIDYASERADLSLQLFDQLWPTLEATGLVAPYDELERPLIPILVAVERTGVRVDAERPRRHVLSRWAPSWLNVRRRSMRWRGWSSTSTHPSSYLRCCSTGWSFRRPSEQARPELPRRRCRCSKSWRWFTICQEKCWNGEACRSSRVPTSTPSPSSSTRAPDASIRLSIKRSRLRGD